MIKKNYYPSNFHNVHRDIQPKRDNDLSMSFTNKAWLSDAGATHLSRRGNQHNLQQGQVKTG